MTLSHSFLKGGRVERHHIVRQQMTYYLCFCPTFLFWYFSVFSTCMRGRMAGGMPKHPYLHQILLPRQHFKRELISAFVKHACALN
jgi:hypothetical protein